MPIVAAVMPAPRQPVELREFVEPEIAPGGLLLRTSYSEVCGTDVHLWHGRLAGVPCPIIPGHVSVGVADKLRGEVTGVDGRRLREGDRVVPGRSASASSRWPACPARRRSSRSAIPAIDSAWRGRWAPR